MFPTAFVNCALIAGALLSASVARCLEVKSNASMDVCAVRVTVTFPGGQPASTEVRLIDPKGKMVSVAETWDGETSFCDFGFGEHTIVVGGDECGSVAIRRVRVRPQSQHFHVVLNRCAEEASHRYPPGCLVYFRVSSQDGTGLAATVTLVERSWSVDTDRFGRLWVGIFEGTTREYVVHAPGHAAERVSVSCRHQQSIERAVVLTPNAR